MGRFITYVCHATRYGLINVVPLLHLDPDRVAEVVQLVGTRQPPTDADRVNAIDPGERFAALVGKLAPHAERRTLMHAPDDDSAWREAVRRLIADRPDRQVVLNLTGGTKGMALGAFIGCLLERQASNAPEPRVLLFRTDPPRVAEIFPATRELAASGAHLAFDGYLALHGFGLIGARADRRRSRGPGGRKPLSEALIAWLRDLPPSDLHSVVAMINGIAHPSWATSKKKLNQAFAGRLRPVVTPGEMADVAARCRAGPFLPHLVGILRGQGRHAGLTIGERGELIVETPHAVRYLGGEWFEEWVFERLLGIFRTQPDAEVMLG